MGAAAVIVSRQNRFIRLYQKAQATHAAAAIAPEQLGIRRSWVFNRMAKAGVFVHAGEGRYYLDQHSADAFRAHRRAKALIGLAVVAILCLVYLLVRSLFVE